VEAVLRFEIAFVCEPIASVNRITPKRATLNLVDHPDPGLNGQHGPNVINNQKLNQIINFNLKIAAIKYNLKLISRFCIVR
jgi:hypothetical protein